MYSSRKHQFPVLLVSIKRLLSERSPTPPPLHLQFRHALNESQRNLDACEPINAFILVFRNLFHGGGKHFQSIHAAKITAVQMAQNAGEGGNKSGESSFNHAVARTSIHKLQAPNAQFAPPKMISPIPKHR
jgi:hypothetical protein